MKAWGLLLDGEMKVAGKITTEPTPVYWNDLFVRMLTSAERQGKAIADIRDSWIIVGIDPGETTGFAVYDPLLGDKITLQQLETKTVESGMRAIEAAWPRTRVQVIVVCEDYKVYGWKADQHKWAGLHTPQLIGAIRYFCALRGYPIFFQMASEAKGWSTDEKLKMWGVYEPGLKHARDALRHIINFLFFCGGNKKLKLFLETSTFTEPDEPEEPTDG